MRCTVLTVTVLFLFVLSHSLPSNALERARLEFTSSLVTFDNQVIYREKNRSWQIYEAIFNPGKTHILISRKYADLREFALRDFKVLYLRQDPGKVPVAITCTLDHDINFDMLGMVEAYWATDSKIAVRAAPLDPGKDTKSPSRPKRLVTRYYEILSP